jgi:hypothetical protein
MAIVARHKWSFSVHEEEWSKLVLDYQAAPTIICNSRTFAVKNW